MTAAVAATSKDTFATARFNMVNGQLRTNKVTNEKLLQQLAEVPRQLFVPSALAGVAYVDEAIRVAPGRYLMEPLALARLLQEACVQPSDTALIVGAGTGYSAAILGGLCTSVVALESEAGLADRARELLADLALVNVSVVTGPLTDGWAKGAPYDIILIDGMVEILPDCICDQLAENGSLVTVKGGEGRSAAGYLYRRTGGVISGRPLFDAGTPPLPGFLPPPAFEF